MVEPKIKKWSYFTVFVLPCLILYIVFFIVPFLRGIAISFTNWDGLTPKTPIVVEKEEFESNIIGKLSKQSDKDFVLSIYQFQSSDNNYHRLSIKGKTRYKLERIFRKAKWQPERYKFVGFENYKQIFTGKVGSNFYPHNKRIEKFLKTSNLPTFISEKEFNKEVLKNIKNAKNPSECEKLLCAAYVFDENNERFKLYKDFDEYLVTDKLWSLDEVEKSKTISESDLDNYIRSIKSESLNGSLDSLNAITSSFLQKNAVSKESSAVFSEVNEDMIKISEVKNALSEVWVVHQSYMGVIGFTLFFAIFSVLGINAVAFALALALDTGIRGQKILRTIYFLPNVLSMIIVALIWSMLFVQLLPALTGIEAWISDSRKTPWLLVFVAIWQGAGYYMIVYLAGLQNIPNEVVEAAMMDGATGWQRFRYITIPMMIPSLTISFFLTIANAFKSFDLIYALLGQTGYATGTVPFVMDIYFDAFANKQAGLANAKAMLLFFAIVLVTGIQLISMKKREVEA